MLERRTLRLSVSQKILPLTSLVGGECVKAWLEAVKLHAFLWSCDIKYGDPTLSNVMYDQDLKCGVLIDYDLPISRQPPGTDTGTIPFMATDLLTDEYWNGEIVRLYRHEFEAFLWILAFVFMRYQNGTSQRDTPVDVWMTSNYITCRKEKNIFWSAREVFENWELCQLDYRDHWMLAGWLLNSWIFWLNAAMIAADRIGDDIFSVVPNVASVWPFYVEQLRLIATKYPSVGYVDTLVDELGLEKGFSRPTPCSQGVV